MPALFSGMAFDVTLFITLSFPGTIILIINMPYLNGLSNNIIEQAFCVP